MVETIGKPVFHRYSGDLYGSWLMDAYEYTEEEEKTKVWATMSDQNRTLFEFQNKSMYRQNHHTKNYSLPLPFTVSDTFDCFPTQRHTGCGSTFRETITSSTTGASFTTTTKPNRSSGINSTQNLLKK